MESMPAPAVPPVADAAPNRARTVDLNADLGEEITDDAALLAVVTSANVACGFHAGNAQTMRQVCEEAARRGVRVGAQVSYDDRANFGRVAHDVAPALLAEQVATQVAALTEAAVSAGIAVEYVKPHGALYHRVIADPEQAAAVLAGSELAGAAGLPVLGMGGAFAQLAEAAGRAVWQEGFPDRGYTAEGLLVPRGEPGALVSEEAAIVQQALALAPRVDSVCLHGDSPGAITHARAVRRALEDAGWAVAPVPRIGDAR